MSGGWLVVGGKLAAAMLRLAEVPILTPPAPVFNASQKNSCSVVYRRHGIVEVKVQQTLAEPRP